MERNLFGISAIIASVALLVSSIGNSFALPQGPSVNVGSNPIFSYGGTISNSTTTLFTAPSDQTMIVTDVVLTMAEQTCTSTITLNTSAGNVSSFKLYSKFYSAGDGYGRSATSIEPKSISHSFNSGVPISLSDSLDIVESGGCNVSYTVSGYYAHP